MLHRIPKDRLDESLTALVRGGERIDSLTLDGDEWVVVTEDRIETRALASSDATGRMLSWSEAAALFAGEAS